MTLIFIRRMSPIVLLCLTTGAIFYFFDQYYVHNTLWGIKPIIQVLSALETQIRSLIH